MVWRLACATRILSNHARFLVFSCFNGLSMKAFAGHDRICEGIAEGLRLHPQYPAANRLSQIGLPVDSKTP